MATRRATAATLRSRDLAPIIGSLRKAHRTGVRAFPGEREDRQPVHTVYGGAHLFRAESAGKLGELAARSLDAYAPDAAQFARAFDLPADVDAGALRHRVAAKLRSEPVEDYRIDFEDGYGYRPDEEEDGHCRSAAGEVARGHTAETLPAFVGIRIKPLSAELHARGLRTLDLFVTALAQALRPSFVPLLLVTVPKVTVAAQVAAAAQACAVLERRLKLPSGVLRLELMIETPQSILGADGASPLRGFVAAGKGRVTAAHFGAYDYTALCGITAAWQDIRHPACDFARHMMQVALAQSGVRLADSVTTTMPVPVHRPAADHELTHAQRRENTEAVHDGWKLHCANVRHSLRHGFYQSWDLHPLQLPARYAAVYEFFSSARTAATARLRHFVEQATHATLSGGTFDDAATAQGLLNFFVRGLTSGALTAEEARETGLTVEELQGRSFTRIVASRRDAR
jgi:citrate lyase beta subunit